MLSKSSDSEQEEINGSFPPVKQAAHDFYFPQGLQELDGRHFQNHLKNLTQG